MDYATGRGVNFSFTGFAPGSDPLTQFNAYKYEECLHSCMVLVYLFTPKEHQYQYLADDGLLHELIHLINGIDICTHNSPDNIRQQIKDLMCAYEEFKTKEIEPIQSFAD
jgi:hypothetical protein